MRFLSILKKIYILLIINHLSLIQKFYLFAGDKKSSKVLKFHFGRKYHFVKLEKYCFVCFYVIYMDVFDRLLLMFKQMFSQTPP